MFVARALPVLAAAALALGACSSTTYTTIPHPLHVGQVAPNNVPFENTREERRRRLPGGSLTDEAQLVSLTPEQICLRVSVWATDIEPARADLSTYSIVLLADDNPGTENTPQSVQLEQPEYGQLHGVRRVYAGGYGTTATSHMYQMTQQPASICFANGGFVTPSTTHLTLELRGPGRTTNINFEWEFSSSVR
ncbi:MAG: hypothetical protein KF729_38525 [Sandaracinaceae bacterium]|nr:hypothetical protein [Sandaracinaceae bacterium]